MTIKMDCEGVHSFFLKEILPNVSVYGGVALVACGTSLLLSSISNRQRLHDASSNKKEQESDTIESLAKVELTVSFYRALSL